MIRPTATASTPILMAGAIARIMPSTCAQAVALSRILLRPRALSKPSNCLGKLCKTPAMRVRGNNGMAGVPAWRVRRPFLTEPLRALVLRAMRFVANSGKPSRLALDFAPRASSRKHHAAQGAGYADCNPFRPSRRRILLFWRRPCKSFPWGAAASRPMPMAQHGACRQTRRLFALSGYLAPWTTRLTGPLNAFQANGQFPNIVGTPDKQIRMKIESIPRGLNSPHLPLRNSSLVRC
jgi:hypothetical protein